MGQCPWDLRPIRSESCCNQASGRRGVLRRAVRDCMGVAKGSGFDQPHPYQALLDSLSAILGKNPGATQVHCLLPPIRWPHSCEPNCLAIFIYCQPPPASFFGCLRVITRKTKKLKVDQGLVRTINRDNAYLAHFYPIILTELFSTFATLFNQPRSKFSFRRLLYHHSFSSEKS